MTQDDPALLSHVPLLLAERARNDSERPSQDARGVRGAPPTPKRGWSPELSHREEQRLEQREQREVAGSAWESRETVSRAAAAATGMTSRTGRTGGPLGALPAGAGPPPQ